MNELLTITDAASRALDKSHPSYVQRHTESDSENANAMPMLRLYNALREFDSEFSGSGIESADSHSTSAASALINATASVDGNDKAVHLINSGLPVSFDREPVFGDVQMPQQRNCTKSIRFPVKNLQEVNLQPLLENNSKTSFDSHRGIHKYEKVAAMTDPRQFYPSRSSDYNLREAVHGTGSSNAIGSKSDESSSTVSLELAKAEHRQWMPFNEHLKHCNLNDGNLEEPCEEERFFESYAGKEVRAILPLKDSGYLTQPIHTIHSTASAVDMIEETCSDEISQGSPVVIRGREDSDLSSRDSGSVNHPGIVTVPQTIVNVRATASATSSSTMGSMDGSSDSELNPAKPFVALKDRFLKFPPVLLKQGVLSTETGSAFRGSSDDVLIEQFIPDEKQRKLQEDFLKRQNGNAAIKKYFPARIIQSSVETVTAKPVTSEVSNSSSSVIPEVVASAAVAAVVATQNIMKSQQEDILQKILELESRKLASESGKPSHNDQLAEELNQRRLETLEAQLADITQKRLSDLERHHHNVQAHLLAISAHAPFASGDQFRGHHSQAQKQKSSAKGEFDECLPWVRFSDEPSLTDVSAVQDMEHEKTSVLDTPAPRQKRPIPTLYREKTMVVNKENKQSVSNTKKEKRDPLLARFSYSRDKEKQRSPQSPTRLNAVDHHSLPKVVDDILSSKLIVAKEVQSEPRNTQIESAPLVQYLSRASKQSVDMSPYPEFKGLGKSRMSALVQYAEAEAVLKNVKANHAHLDSNLETIERFRNKIDFGSATSHDRSVADKMRIKRVVGQRINAISKQVEIEVEEQMMQEKLCEAKKFSHPEKNIAGLRGKQQLVGRSHPEKYRKEPHNFIVPDKENIPKKVKPKSVKKPRPLNPIEDENRLQQIYGKALYHKLRSSQKQVVSKCQRESPKSKLPRSPIKISRVEVKGIEMASAKTQTSLIGKTPNSGQFVQGLQGQMIPMAIPMSLIHQEKQLHRVSQSIQPNSPKKKMQFAFEMPEQPQEFPTAANVSDVVEDEEQETTMTEGGEMISLPGHTSPPSAYHGPRFPVRIPTVQLCPTSDVLAADIRRANILQKQAVDWVEQELMARIISEMYGRRERESKVAEEHLKLVAEKEKEEEISVSSVNSEDSISVQNSINVDTIGHHGVQLFVDAGRPVDDRLVSALIREVLAEKISSMFGSGEMTVVQETPVADQTKTSHAKLKPNNVAVVEDVILHHPQTAQVVHSLIPTPEPTPEPSSSYSTPSQTSLPSTPRSPPAVVAVEDKALRDVQSNADEKEESEDDVSFPTYEGMSDSESQKADVMPLVEMHDVQTPSITPVPSPLSMMRTPSPSSTAEPIILPAKETKEIQTDMELITAPVPLSATTVLQKPEEIVESEPSIEGEPLLSGLSPPKSEVSSPVVNVHLSPKHEEESVSLPTESSTANNENISEGQWIITLLSEGEIPHNIPLDEALKQRVRQHMINASRLRNSVDEDTYANTDDIDQDSASEVFPSEGEVLFPPCRLSDQKMMVKALKRPKSLAGHNLLAPVGELGVQRVDQSVGEIRFGPEITEQMNNNAQHGIHKYGKGRYDNNRSSLKSPLLEENRMSVGELQFDNANGNVYSVLGHGIRRSPSSVNQGLSPQADKNASILGHGDVVSAKPASIIQVKAAGECSVSPVKGSELPKTQDLVLQPSGSSASGASNGARTGVKGRIQAGTGRVMSTRDPSERMHSKRPPIASAEGPGRSKSPQQKNSSNDFMKHSYETDISQNTASLLDSDRRESKTPDQMNIDAIMQSRDYFTQSEFGSTGQSLRNAGTVKGQQPFLSTYSLPKSVDFELGTSTQDSLQFEPTETNGSEPFSNRLEDSLEGTEVSKYDDLEYRRELERLASSDESRFHTPIKIPSVSAFNDGSDTELQKSQT